MNWVEKYSSLGRQRFKVLYTGRNLKVVGVRCSRKEEGNGEWGMAFWGHGKGWQSQRLYRNAMPFSSEHVLEHEPMNETN